MNSRSKEVDNLLEVFPSCRVLNNQRTAIDLPVESSGGQFTFLRIELSPVFPQEGPLLRIIDPANVPWVDNKGNIVKSDLIWRAGKSTLTSLVSECLDALRLSTYDPHDGYGGASTSPLPYDVPAPRPSVIPAIPRSGSSNASRIPDVSPPLAPPAIPAMPYGTGPSALPKPATGGGGGNLGGGGGDGGGGHSGVDYAQVSSSLFQGLEASLEQKPVTELMSLLNDPTKFEHQLEGVLNCSPALHTLREVQARIQRLAERNLDLENKVSQARSHVAIVKAGDFAAAQASFDDLCRRHDAVVEKLHPRALIKSLEREREEIDKASDDLTMRFQACAAKDNASGSNGLSIEQFTEQYLQLRMRYHSSDLRRQAAVAQFAGASAGTGVAVAATR